MAKPRKSSKEKEKEGQLSLDEHFLSEEARELLRLGKIEKRRRERKARTLNALRAQGVPPTGTAPYGKRIRADGRLEDDPGEKKIIDFIVRELSAGESIRAVAKKCNEEGFKNRAGHAIATSLVVIVRKRELPHLKLKIGRRPGKKNLSDHPKRAA